MFIKKFFANGNVSWTSLTVFLQQRGLEDKHFVKWLSLSEKFDAKCVTGMFSEIGRNVDVLKQ